MHPDCLKTRKTERRSLNQLMEEINVINKQKTEVVKIKLPLMLEQEVFKVLTERKDEIKELMHDCIDDL